MVPWAFLPIPALPLTPTGKVDRRALPMPEPVAVSTPLSASRDPETIVAVIVRDAIGAATLSSTESLSELGLDSLGMSAILVGIEDAFGIVTSEGDITPELFESVASLSRYVRRSLADVTP